MSALRATQITLYLLGEAGWLVAWSAAVGRWIGPGDTALLGLPVLLTLLVAATVLTRLASGPGNVGGPAQLLVAVLGLIVSGLIGFAAVDAARGGATWGEVWRTWASTSLGFRDLATIALALVAWWRGIVAGRARIDLDRVQSALRGQSIALVVLFLLNAVASSGSAPAASPLGGVLLVVFAGLVGLPLARLLDLRVSERGRAATLGVNRHWVAMLLGAVAGVLVFALVLAAVFTFDRIDRLLQPLGVVADLLLLIVVYAIGLPVAYLAQWLIGLIPRRGAPPVRKPMVGLPDVIRQLQQQHGQARPDTLLEILKWGMLAVLVVAVVLFLYQAAARYLERPAPEELDETRDFVWSWDEVKSALRAWVLALLGRRRRRAARTGVAAIGEEIVGSLLDPRALYRELLRLGARRGRRRAPSETPREYERALAETPRFAGTERQIDAITVAYIQARYGEDAPGPAVVDAAQEALERLKQAMGGEDGDDAG